jgi:AMMECR1 domain-containing protein
MDVEQFTRKLVVVLPDVAYNDEWGAQNFFNNLLQKINKAPDLQKKTQY